MTLLRMHVVLIFCKEALCFPGRRLSAWVLRLILVMGTRQTLSTSFSVLCDPANTECWQACPLAFNLILLLAGEENVYLSLRFW